MSTTLKKIEASCGIEAARELENAMNNLGRQIRNNVAEARNVAQQEINRLATNLRQEQRAREDAIINRLSSETDNKLSQLELRQRQAMQRQAEQLNNAIQQQGRDFTNKLREQDQRFDARLSNVETAIRVDMRAQEQRLNENIRAVRTETLGLINDLTNHVNREFHKQQGQINTLNQEMANTKQDIKNIRQELQAIYDKEAINQSTANAWIDRCKQLIKECQQNTAINRFESVRLRQLENRLSTQELIGNAAPQAAMANALNVMNEIWDLQENAQLKQAIFEMLYTNSLASAKALLGMMHQNKNNTFLKDSEGKDILNDKGERLKIEIDYWMQGGYQNLEDKLRALQSELETGLNNPSFTQERVEQILQEIKGLEIEEREMVITAAMRGVASEERAFLCQDIIEELERNHFRIKSGGDGDENGYVGADFREGVFANLENSLGTDISIIVQPDETLLKNTIVIQRNDNVTRNATQVEEVTRILERSLNRGACSEVNRRQIADEKVFDPAALKRAGLSQESKQRITQQRR